MAAIATPKAQTNLEPGRSIRVTATVTSVVAGVLAVVAGEFFDTRPPDAYGLCMACHGRDLIDWMLNMLAHTHLQVAAASAVYPVLTTIGVLIGGVVAAFSSGEFHWHNPDNPIKTFLYGILVMNFALIAGGCSIRLLLRTSSGEMLGAVGFGGLIGGVILGTFWLRWRASR